MPPLRLLHIAPHAGGGIGSVLRPLIADQLASHAYVPQLLTLDHLNDKTRRFCNNLHIPWADSIGVDPLNAYSHIKAADVVIIHWWNHPLLTALLAQGLPSSRYLIWCHVNGYHAPQSITDEILNLPAKIIFTSSTSMNIPAVKETQARHRKQFSVIPSTCGLPKHLPVTAHKQNPFTAGYVGTVDPAKLHKAFLDIIEKSDLEHPVAVAGGPEAHVAKIKEKPAKGT